MASGLPTWVMQRVQGSAIATPKLGISQVKSFSKSLAKARPISASGRSPLQKEFLGRIVWPTSRIYVARTAVRTDGSEDCMVGYSRPPRICRLQEGTMHFRKKAVCSQGRFGFLPVVCPEAKSAIGSTYVLRTMKMTALNSVHHMIQMKRSMSKAIPSSSRSIKPSKCDRTLPKYLWHCWGTPQTDP